MFPRSSNTQIPRQWDAIERSVAAQARAQKLCEEAERIRRDSRNLRAGSRQLREASQKIARDAAEAIDRADTCTFTSSQN
jgi:hypothetical protein